MDRQLPNSEIHRATVTHGELHDEGACMIDIDAHNRCCTPRHAVPVHGIGA